MWGNTQGLKKIYSWTWRFIDIYRAGNDMFIEKVSSSIHQGKKNFLLQKEDNGRVILRDDHMSSQKYLDRLLQSVDKWTLGQQSVGRLSCLI